MWFGRAALGDNLEDDFAPEAVKMHTYRLFRCNKAHMVHTMYISYISYRIDNRDSELFTICSHTGAKQVADRADRADRRGS